jgi:hypothetical protein
MLTWLQDLDDYPLISGGVDALIHFRVFSSPYFLDDLVIVLGSIEREVVRQVEWSGNIYPNLTSKFS